jgi:hypothetical protein
MMYLLDTDDNHERPDTRLQFIHKPLRKPFALSLSKGEYALTIHNRQFNTFYASSFRCPLQTHKTAVIDIINK